jgi:hypothetical protein
VTGHSTLELPNDCFTFETGTWRSVAACRSASDRLHSRRTGTPDPQRNMSRRLRCPKGHAAALPQSASRRRACATAGGLLIRLWRCTRSRNLLCLNDRRSRELRQVTGMLSEPHHRDLRLASSSAASTWARVLPGPTSTLGSGRGTFRAGSGPCRRRGWCRHGWPQPVRAAHLRGSWFATRAVRKGTLSQDDSTLSQSSCWMTTR